MDRRLTLAFVFLAACASQMATRPKTISRPLMEPRLAAPIYFGGGNTAPATIDVLIQNTAQVPIVVRRVEVDSPGMVMYSLQKAVRSFRETIAPGETRTLTVPAMAVTQVARPTEPLAIRVLVEFEAGQSVWREMVLTH